jgi:hypothetical protein
MKRRYAVLAVAMVVGLLACHKQADDDQAFLGTWQWVSTDGGIANQIHDTPASTGRNVELQLLSNGTYVCKTGASVTSSGTYRVEKRKCIHDHTQKDYLLFSADPGMMMESINDEALLLSDEAFDGLTSQYIRQ